MSSAPEYPPEYVNHDGGPLAIRVMTAVVVLATLFVGLRIGVRINRRVGLNLDDWLAVVALIVAWAEYADGELCIKLGGVGLHLPIALERRPNAIRNTFLYIFAGELIYFTTLALIKWSILAMYYRLFPTRFMKWGYIVLGSMTGLWWVAVMLVAIFQCTPVHRFWDLATPGTCVDANVFYISTNGVPNIIMDAMILSLPIYEVYKLHVSRKIKIAIAANFLLGAVVIIASIVKLKIMVDLYYMGPSADITYHLAPLIIWVEVEPCMGIISACLPTLRPILTFVLRLVGFSKDASAGANTPGKPSPLVTFGRGNARQKRGDYTTVRRMENDQNSLEHLSGWPEMHDDNPTSIVIAGQGNVELNQYGAGRHGASQPQSIAVRTDVVWHQSHVQQGMGGRLAHML